MIKELVLPSFLPICCWCLFAITSFPIQSTPILGLGYQKPTQGNLPILRTTLLVTILAKSVSRKAEGKWCSALRSYLYTSRPRCALR